MRLVSRIKTMMAPAERKPRRIQAGAFRGMVMNLSLRSQAQFYLGLFERETHPWLRRLSTGIATAIDIGVAHGEHTIYFLRKTGAGRVLAFEPDQACLPFLHENLRLNGLEESERLELSTKFVGDSDTQREIRLDSLAPTVQFPCLVKMDVDGAEETILNGAPIFNRAGDVRWIIETHSMELERACQAILKAAGFEVRVIRNGWWRALIPEMRPCAHNRWLAAWRLDSQQR